MNESLILVLLCAFVTVPLAFIPMALFGVWAGEKEKQTGNDLWGLAFGLGTQAILWIVGLLPFWIDWIINGAPW